MSTFEDARRFMNFIVSSFVSLSSESGHMYPLRSRAIPLPAEGLESVTARHCLRSITLYPIKSCAGFTVDSWPLSSTGLLHDREWLLKSISGEILTQKKVQGVADNLAIFRFVGHRPYWWSMGLMDKIPEMCYISALIDLNLGILFVESPRCKEKLQIELKSDSSFAGRDEMDIYTQRYGVQGYGNDIDIWFGNAVGRPCTLLRNSGSQINFSSNNNRSVGMCRDVDTRLNFVNEAQFLLISEESVSDLNNRLSSNVQKGSHGPPVQVNPMRFRPNLVISGGEPYAEDKWRNLKIGNQYFTSLGGCNRCQMINLNLQAEEVQRSSEPLVTLATYRRVKGKIFFGILLRWEDGDSNEVRQEIGPWLQVGQQIYPNAD